MSVTSNSNVLGAVTAVPPLPTAKVEICFNQDPFPTYYNSVAGLAMAYWRLDEASGDFTDSSQNGWDGTVVNAGALSYNQAGALPGDSNDHAVKFAQSGGLNGYATTLLTLSTAQLALGFSIECWFKSGAVPTGGDAIIAGIPSSVQLYIHTTGQPTIGYNAGAGTITYVLPTNVCDGAWHHITGYWDTARLGIFLDGSADYTASNVQTTPAVGNATALGIGAYRDGTASFGAGFGTTGATLDEVAVYLAPLTPLQDQNHYISKDVITAQTWTDITPDVMDIQTQVGEQWERNQTETGTASLTIDNTSRKYDPTNAASPYYPNVIPLRQIRISALHNSSAELQYNPMLFWPLSEAVGSSTVSDLTSSGHTGTVGAGVTLGQALTADGNTTALFNNGSTAKITSTYRPFVTDSARTVMGWGYRLGSSDADTLFASSDTGASAQVYLQADAGSQSVDFSVGGGLTVTWTAAIPGNSQWFHWALIYDDGLGVSELFINGVSKGQQFQPNFYNVGGMPTNFQIGALGTSTNPFNGYMQNVAVYEYSLTSDQILAAFNGQAWLFRGYIERWPQMWENPDWADVQITCVDGMEYMTQAALDGYIAQGLSGTQINRALDIAGWSRSARNVDPGNYTTAAALFWPFNGSGDSDTDALTWIQGVAQSESGTFYIAPTGFATFQDNDYRITNGRSVLSQGTFGDADDESELLYTNLIASFDVDRLINDARITASSVNAETTLGADMTAIATTLTVSSAAGFPTSGNYPILVDLEQMLVTGGQGTTTWTVTRAYNGSTAAVHSQGAVVYSGTTVTSSTNTASIRQYFRRSYTLGTSLVNTSNAQAYATSLTANYAQPKERFDGITIKPLNNPSLWLQALARTVSDRVTINRRPPGGGSMISQPVYIEHISWHIPAAGEPWEVTWITSPALGAFVLDIANLDNTSYQI